LLERFLESVAARVGDVEILSGAACAQRYRDPFQLFVDGPPPPAALRPRSVDEVRVIVREANACGVALWPISRGENLGYGGAAPAEEGTVVLDLARMNRILEVNVPDAFCLVEPGVSFIDLFDRLERDGLPLWLSVPGYGLGSVAGNALERGVGNSPYGDHAAQICGLEVVLGDGELLRTGMGALPGSGMWQRHRSPLGPRLDELFLQSGYGIVTKLGLWLMPEPEASAAVEAEIESRESLAGAIDALTRLKRAGVVQDSPVVASYLTQAALHSTRAEWGPPGAALSGEAEGRLRAALGLGWWNARVRVYGPPEVVDLGVARAEHAFAGVPGCTVRVSRWRAGEPMARAHRGLPTAEGLANRNWCGPHGAHIDLAVGLPLSGAEATRYAFFVSETMAAADLDYHAAFYLRDRHILNVVQILFDQADSAMCQVVDAVYFRLIEDAARRGFGLHRAPTRYRAAAMAAYDFGDGAMRRVRERLKRALDPNAVLSPGKDGLG
jgi:4-cresol dehydrogenase (hydroxylating)